MSPKKPTTSSTKPTDPIALSAKTDTTKPEATTTVTTTPKVLRGRTAKVLEPAYALLGATELTVDTLRSLGSTDTGAEENRRGLAALRGEVADVARGARKAPGLAMSELLKGYAQLAERGQHTVTEAIPAINRARATGEAHLHAEEARARREARRLARQAGVAVGRGRNAVTGAADDATRVASKVADDATRAAGKVVEAVTHAGHDDAHTTRRPEARRRAAVIDTSVTATSPTGGEADAPVRHDRVTAGIEAGATTTARRSPRARKAAAAAAEATSTATGTSAARGTSAASPSAAGSPIAKTAKKTAKKTTKKAAPKSGPTPSTPASAPKAPAASAGSEIQIVKTPSDDIDIPTPADVAAAVRENDQLD